MPDACDVEPLVQQRDVVSARRVLRVEVYATESTVRGS
jgi:hypothetical protein